MKRPPRPRYPRIGCSVPGCKRGTTTFEPGTRMICGKHWRKVPVDLRREHSRWRRKATALDKRDDPRADICHRRCSQAWERALRLLTAPPSESDEIPPLMAEELRKAGLA